MRTVTAAVIAGGVLFATMATGWAQAPTTTEKAPAPATKDKMPGGREAAGVKVHGTVDAVDKEKGTVTLKGPKGRTVTLAVKDKSKLDVIKVGDPVVATYIEAVAFQVRKAGSGAPGMSVKEERATSKPGENPAGAVARQVTVTATIDAIDKKAHTVTIKGPEGNAETIKVKNPKNLEGVKVGDLVDITYAQALAVALDKPAPKATK
jgi:Cu/Ag efflux protein CusF